MTKPYGYVRADGQGIFIYGEHQFQNAQGVELIPVYTEQPQPKEQEPVAWIYEFYADMGHKRLAFEEQRSAYNTPLYTAPPQRTWVGLDDEELIECEKLADISHRKHMGSIRGQQLSPADQFLWHYAHAIEAKLRSKNHE